MTNFGRDEFLTLEDSKLCRNFIVNTKTCSWMLVGKRWEDGTQISRNLDYCGMFGWRFTEPGKYYSRYYTRFKAVEDNWGDYTPSLANFSWHKPDEKERGLILKKYPDFKWVMAKADYTMTQIFKVLPLWRKNSKLCETLVSMGYKHLALNGSLYSAKDPWSIVKYISKNNVNEFENLQDVRLAMQGIDWGDIHDYRNFNKRSNYLTYEEWEYMRCQKFGASFYRDYKKMAKKAGHNLHDRYWKFPKDLRKAHDKVMAECEELDRIKREAEMKALQGKYFQAVKKFCKKEFSAGNVTVFVASQYVDWDKHAKALHQCIVANRYVDSVISGKKMIVFVTKNGKPYATAELYKSGNGYKLGQFYGDEHLKNYNAKPDAKKAFNGWVTMNKIKMVA